MKDNTKWLLLALTLGTSALLSGCGYVAAGAAGAVIGREVAEDREEEDEEQAGNQ